MRDATVLVGRRLLVTSFCLSLCTQAAKGGTVKAASGFNAAEDAQTLRKAMKGLGLSRNKLDLFEAEKGSQHG